MTVLPFREPVNQPAAYLLVNGSFESARFMRYMRFKNRAMVHRRMLLKKAGKKYKDVEMKNG
jgi:hypothetical protein